MREYSRHDALALADLIRAGEVSAREVLEAAIARAEACIDLNAISTKGYELARKAVDAGPPPGPFAGVPFLIKDLYAPCEGMITSNGSRFFHDNLSDHDSEMVARYKRGGLVIFGKSNTPEFGLTVTTEPKAFGATRNPWNREYSAGGSSGGAAAAVAAGIVPVAHATDGGGSIRIPASCCGLVGLKPTRARNPAGPDRGEGWAGMSHEHVVSRTVRDSAALLDLTAGPDRGAPYYAERPTRPFLAEVGADPGRLRIGMVRRTPTGEALDPECLRAVQDTALLLTALGHEVDEAMLPALPESFMASVRTAIGGSVRAVIDAHAKRMGRAPQREQFEWVTWMFHELGGRATAGEYAQAVLDIHRSGRQVASWFDGFDLLLTPTMADPPARLGVLDMDQPVAQDYLRAISRYTAFTNPFNASGSPAISLPLHMSAAGLPVGVQLAAPYAGEGLLLRVAAQLEAARPWSQRHPPD